MTTAVADRTLTTVDRCDRCGAQAYVRVVLGASGGELLFCGHHARAVEPTPSPAQLGLARRDRPPHEKEPVSVD